MPSILMKLSNLSKDYLKVLNLVISGMPSIHAIQHIRSPIVYGFKPCYKWNAFNTVFKGMVKTEMKKVLNLIITGIPSILQRSRI